MSLISSFFTKPLEDKIKTLESQNKKLKKRIEQGQNALSNFKEKVYTINDSDCGIVGEDYENEKPEKRLNAINELIDKLSF